VINECSCGTFIFAKTNSMIYKLTSDTNIANNIKLVG
jgi:hypothetical protein